MVNLKRKAVKLSDVASDAGVSTATVSRVINGDRKVKEVTREKVAKSIARLGFSPNQAARKLAGANPVRIGLIYTNPSSAYLGELLVGALNAASSVGASVSVLGADTDMSPREIAEGYGAQFDALIVPPPLSDFNGVRKIVRDYDIPAAFLSSAAGEEGGFEIRIDDYAASKQVVQLLIEKGHTRIGLIKGHPNQTVSEVRFQGYRDALIEAGISVDPSLVSQGFFTYRSGVDAANELLGLNPRPTAIFACNDEMAAGALSAAARHQMSVPRDLSLVGFDDSPLATHLWPSLTTVRQPVAEMAARAVELINRAIGKRSKSAEPEVVYHAHVLIERESVSVPPY